MKKGSLIFLFLFFFISLQHVEAAHLISRIDSLCKMLSDNGIRKIGYYYQGSKNTFYVFLEDKGKCYLMKLDDTTNKYNRIQVKKDYFFDFYFRYKARIDNEEVNDLMTKSKKTSIPDLYDPSHTSINSITIYSGILYKEIKPFDLQKKYSGKVNINYQKNKKMKLIKWYRKITKLIAKSEEAFL